MAEKIYTIPINEAFDMYNGCPLCRLKDRLEEQTLNYMLGAAMMEPDVRIEMNKTGFCHEHFKSMFSMKNKLALALILESHLDEVRKNFNTEASGGRKSIFNKKKPEKEDAADELDRFSKSCMVCSKVRHTEARYYSNLLYLWENDEEFREKLEKQPFFCVTHYSGLLKFAKGTMKGEDYAELYSALTDVEVRYFEKLRASVTGFCVSFDHRNAGKPLTEEERLASENAIKALR